MAGDEKLVAAKFAPPRKFTNSGSEFLYSAYLEEYNRGGPPNLDKLHAKFNRFCVVLMGAYVCNLDLMASSEPAGERAASAAGARQTAGRKPARSEDNGPRIFGAGRLGSSSIARMFAKVLSHIFGSFPMPARRSSWRRRLRMGWIPHAIFALYVVSNIVIILDLNYLYRYDISRWRLERVHELAGQSNASRFAHNNYAPAAASNNPRLSGENAQELRSIERHLARRMDEARRALRLLGDKFLSWGVANECLYLLVVLFAFFSYATFQWLYLWMNKHDVHPVRDLIDYKGEQRRTHSICEAEVLKFLDSIWVHTKNYYECCNPLVLVSPPAESARLAGKYLYGQMDWPQFTPARRRSVACGKPAAAAKQRTPVELINEHFANLKRTDANNYRNCLLLLQMFTSGALRPLNTSSRWIERRNELQFGLHVVIISYTSAFALAIVYAPYKRGFQSLDPGELCIAFLMLLIYVTFNYFVTVFAVACLDQAVLVNRTLGIINDCISANRREFASYTSSFASSNRAAEHAEDGERNDQKGEPESCPTAASNNNNEPRAALRAEPQLGQNGTRAPAAAQSTIDKINSNYLFALLSYKIFVAQFKPLKRTLRGFFLLALVLTFTVPITIRAHVPYFEQGANATPQQLRLFSFFLVMTALVPTNSACLPVCYLHARCKRLYPALSSLLAHIIAVRQHPGGRRLYNEHAVTILTKELSNPHQLIKMFVTSSLGVNGTYQALIKLHFWWGFVLLSILVDSSLEVNRGEVLSALLSDPLGVWSF